MKRNTVLSIVVAMVVVACAGPSIAQDGAPPADGSSATPAAGDTAPPAPGGENPAPGANPGAGGGPNFLMPMMIIFALFYFIMLRPGRRKEKDRTTRVTTIEKNTQVITRGGIIGKVVSVNEDRHELTILTDEKTDTRLKISRSGIWDVYDPSEADEKKN
ncbi:MAG: preprotein translocase subunit YajC [Planctomycetota bacterium]|nr:preprotein translocase subunit YajC [Planctomycetota bacterium]